MGLGREQGHPPSFLHLTCHSERSAPYLSFRAQRTLLVIPSAAHLLVISEAQRTYLSFRAKPRNLSGGARPSTNALPKRCSTPPVPEPAEGLNMTTKGSGRTPPCLYSPRVRKSTR